MLFSEVLHVMSSSIKVTLDNSSMVGSYDFFFGSGRGGSWGSVPNFNFKFQHEVQLQSMTWYETLMLGGTSPKKVSLTCISQFCIVQEKIAFEIFSPETFCQIRISLQILVYQKNPPSSWTMQSSKESARDTFVEHIQAFQNHMWFMGVGVEVQEISWSLGGIQGSPTCLGPTLDRS